MKRLLKIRAEAKKYKKRIVLPEADEPRVIEAARFIEKEGMAEIILLEDAIKAAHEKELAEKFFAATGAKYSSAEEIRAILRNSPTLFAALMVRFGMADGFVSGAKLTSAEVIRDALRGLPIDRKIGTVSGAFIMVLREPAFGEKGLLIYADCGVIPSPSSAQLARIAVSCNKFLYDFFGVKGRIAMLSYSTKGSAEGESVDKVREAVRIIKEKNPGITIDGELQFDAALIPEVARIKSPGSPVAGKANILIFPNLESGNIVYKATERLAHARAVGPILLGFTKAASDLSRGASVEDIVDAIAVTAVRAEKLAVL